MTKKQFVELQKTNEQLREQNALLTKKCERQTEQYHHLLQAFKEFQRNRFGSRSEKFIDPEHPQTELFPHSTQTTPEPESNKEITDDSNVISMAERRSCKRSKKVPNPHLPRRELIIPVEDKACLCGCEKVVIRYEMTELMHYVPPVFEIIEQKREVVACKKTCADAMETAANPPRILPKANVTAELLAYIIVSKLHDRQPFYHLEKKFAKQFGFHCQRNTMARWCIGSSREVQPLINLMKDTILGYDISSTDATSIQVLREPGREPTKKSYAYCIRGGPPDKGCIVYDYNAENHKQFMLDWFEGFSGHIHVDAQNIFDELFERKGVTAVYCHAHARRKFEAVAKQVKRSDGLAKEALRFYQRIYRIENEANEQGMTARQRRVLRLKKTKPLLDKFKQWLDTEYPLLLPESPLAKAFAYALNHWDGLITFLNDGRLFIDNNHTEREIKPWVIARKNFLFASSIDGVNANCHYMSLIRTALLHGLEPYQYLAAVFNRIPYCQTVEDYEELLPWNISQSTFNSEKEAA